MGSKSVTTKSMSESSRETFVFLSLLHNKLLARNYSNHRMNNSERQNNQTSIVRPIKEVELAEANSPNSELDRPIQLTQPRVGSVFSKLVVVELDQSRTMHSSLWNFSLPASVKLSLVSFQSELPLKFTEKNNKDLFSRIKFGSIVKRR